MKNVDFIRNAKDIDLYRTGHNKGEVTLVVNDLKVELNRRHPISVAASLTTPEDALESIRGGHFVIEHGADIETSLKEWRDATYTGFMQTDDFIARFGGDTSLAERGFGDFSITEFGKGGEFKLTTGFEWSAFNKNLKTQVNILRQICENGMIARRPMFEREVPIINLFDHHLDIAARQLVDIARKEISQRLEVMGREHAYVKDVNLVQSHVQRRITAEPTNDRLIKINDALSLYGDVTKYYKQSAIDNGIVKALPSPISRFDLWNITTELNSHTHELVESTSSSLDRIATGLIFPKKIGGVIAERAVKQSTFGSPEQAFFGA